MCTFTCGLMFFFGKPLSGSRNNFFCFWRSVSRRVSTSAYTLPIICEHKKVISIDFWRYGIKNIRYPLDILILLAFCFRKMTRGLLKINYHSKCKVWHCCNFLDHQSAAGMQTTIGWPCVFDAFATLVWCFYSSVVAWRICDVCACISCSIHLSCLLAVQ